MYITSIFTGSNYCHCYSLLCTNHRNLTILMDMMVLQTNMPKNQNIREMCQSKCRQSRHHMYCVHLLHSEPVNISNSTIKQQIFSATSSVNQSVQLTTWFNKFWLTPTDHVTHCITPSHHCVVPKAGLCV